jgi:hypothetical protein
MSARGLFLRWLPTALGAAMLVAELPLVSVSASRSARPGEALAALGIGMSVLVVVNAPALALAGLTVVAADAGETRLGRHALLTGLTGCAVLLVLATPPALAGLRTVLGIDHSLTAEVRGCLLSLAPNPLGVALRRRLHGRMIRADHTRPIAWATLSRIAASAALAWLAVSLLPEHGAAAAGLALSAGAFTEALLLTPVVRRLPRATGDVTRLGRRHAQLTTPWLLNNLPALVTTVGIAHAAQSVASLVVWPVTYHLAALFSSPLADWDTVTAAARDRRAVRIVTWWLTVGFAVLFALVIVSDVDTLFVTRLTAVPSEPAALGLTWLPLLLPMPALWVLRGTVRGVVMAGSRRTPLVLASIAHLLALTTTVTTLGRTALPGVAVGALAVLAGLLAELLALATSGPFRSRPGDRQPVSTVRAVFGHTGTGMPCGHR